MLNDCFAKQKEIIAERDLLKAGQEEINPQSLNSLLKIVATMATIKYKYNREENKSAVPGIIVKSAETLGFTITAKTVREWLREATSPERIDQQNLI